MQPDLAAGSLETIRSALAGRPGKACVTCSFQAEGVVLAHMLIQVQPGIPVLFLDTGYHFAETLEYRDRITRELNLNLRNIEPQLTVAAQEQQFGILYDSAPDRCCAMRKVEPLFRALEDYDIWFAGLRRDQSPTRAELRTSADFKLPSGKVLSKVSPMADWAARDVWKYLKDRNIPLLPLYDRGFASVGCEPCTELPVDPDNPRSGRWSGKKLECGIHIGAR